MWLFVSTFSPELMLSLWRSEKGFSGEAPAQSSARPTSGVRTAAAPTLPPGPPSASTAYQSPGRGETSLSRIGCSSKAIAVCSSSPDAAFATRRPLFLSSLIKRILLWNFPVSMTTLRPRPNRSRLWTRLLLRHPSIS